MRRASFPVLAAIVLATVPGPAAPRLKDASELGYFPTAIGTRWVYKVGETELIEVVTAVTRADGVTTVTVQKKEEGGTLTPRYKIEIRSEGLFMTEETGQPYDPPMCLLKLPVQPGEKWDSTTRRPDLGLVTSHCELIGVEDVDTPAGRFRAVRVQKELVFENGGPGEPLVSWYAPGVGLVMQTRRALQSFTPGKR